MTTDELRAKFEAWFRSKFTRWSPDKSGGVMAWLGYQQGYASRDAEVEALRKDAERYQLLRSCSGYQAPFCVTQNIGHDWIIVRRDELDQAIDAAMREVE